MPPVAARVKRFDRLLVYAVHGDFVLFQCKKGEPFRDLRAGDIRKPQIRVRIP
jgi:hypothetical protein